MFRPSRKCVFPCRRQLPVVSRYLSFHLKPDNEDAKPKSSAKSKLARSMARVVNSEPWSNELESSLSSLSESLSKTAFHQTLRLIKHPAKALRFFDWVSEKGFSHDHQSFSRMLEILGQARNLNAARNFLFSIEKRSNGSVKLKDRFFNSLIRSYGDAGLFQESIKVFEMMKSAGVSPSVVSFNSLLSILLNRGRTNMARSVFDEMLGTYGVSPDSFTFNILIRGYCKNSMVDEAFRFFSQMERFKCDPDVITYNSIVDGLCRVGKVKIAHNVVKGMTKKPMHLHPNVITYTTLLRGYCMKHEIDEALVVFSEMLCQGLQPNEITYNTLIKGLCETQRFDKIKEIFGGGDTFNGFAPDTCTFNVLIDTYCRAGKLDEAMKVFERMSNLKLQPDSATYSVLIRNLCHIRDFDRAEKLFDEISQKEIVLRDSGCKPFVAAYNHMFEYMCVNGKTEKAEGLFRQLMKRGAQDPHSFKILIMGHCKEGTFKAGYELLVLMLRREFVPDFETYESLINGFLHKHEALLAYETLQKMLRSFHVPQTSIYHSVLSGLLGKRRAHESFGLLMIMLEKKIRHNIDLSTLTVRLLYEKGLQDQAFQVVRLLYDNGYAVNSEDLITFLCKVRKRLEAYKLVLFCLEKHQSIDIGICDKVIEELLKSSKLSEAFRLYYELVEKGNHQHLSCHEDLKNSLHAAGKRDELQFVAKRMPKM